MSLSPTELTALARKYRELSRLRAAPSPAPPAELSALAEEFPGSLRELETLPTEEIERRARSAEAALAGSPVEPLLEWTAGYHACVRLVLAIKQRLAGRRELSPAEATELARRASEERSTVPSAELIRLVASPPGGRLNDLVVSELAARFDTTPEQLLRVLFGEHHRSCRSG